MRKAPQRQREQMTQEHIQLALEAARVGIWDLDLHTDQLVCTDQCRTLYGLPPGTPVSRQDLLAMIHPEDRELVARLTDQRLAEREDIVNDYRVIWPDGSTHWLVNKGRGIYDRQGRPVHAIGVVGEIAERKQAEEEIERQKDLFLSMISHELRTPLTALNGTLQLMERRAKRLSATTAQISLEAETFVSKLLKDLTTAIRQAQIQTRLVNDLLEVARITAGTLELSLKSCDLLDIVRETVEDLQVMAPGRVLLLDLPAQTMVPVLVDRDRIKEVVANYLTNALRYSRPEQPVHIGVSQEQGMARVWVRNQGPGLSKQAQTAIWQRFLQSEEAPALDGSRNALGLGLSICQRLIEAHQGAVGVESAPGAGSTFWFRLPIVKEAREQGLAENA